MSTLNQNNKKKRLTTDELRSFKGLEQMTEQMAENTIRTLEQLSILLIDLFEKQKDKLLKPKRHEKRKAA